MEIDVAPIALLKVPAAHRLHVVFETAPIALLHDPAGQSVELIELNGQ